MSCLKNFPFVLFFRLRLSKALKVNHFVSIPYLRVVCSFYVIAVVQHRINALCLVLASTLDSTLKFYLSIEKIPCMLADSMFNVFGMLFPSISCRYRSLFVILVIVSAHSDRL